jgi:nucleoside-diphosphate-sugar epimerase
MYRGSRILIAGVGGMIGSCLADVFWYLNKTFNLQCKVYGIGRNAREAQKRFNGQEEDTNFQFLTADIDEGIPQEIGEVNYIIHAASNTHPAAYAADPIGTITTNVIGTNQLLRYAVSYGCKRFVFLSSVEVYGENRGDTDKFDESYCGYIDCNTLRAGYPESKRAGEALCQAYIKQKGIDIVISRLSRVYGPTMKWSDTKAISQFLKRAVEGQDIILKSEGNQLYSYSYVADAVSGILTCLCKGEKGEAYNIVGRASDCTLKHLAAFIADCVGMQVKFEIPDSTESLGYSKATKAVMEGKKMERLGWQEKYGLEKGIIKTIDVLKKRRYEIPATERQNI